MFSIVKTPPICTGHLRSFMNLSKHSGPNRKTVSRLTKMWYTFIFFSTIEPVIWDIYTRTELPFVTQLLPWPPPVIPTYELIDCFVTVIHTRSNSWHTSHKTKCWAPLSLGRQPTNSLPRFAVLSRKNTTSQVILIESIKHRQSACVVTASNQDPCLVVNIGQDTSLPGTWADKRRNQVISPPPSFTSFKIISGLKNPYFTGIVSVSEFGLCSANEDQIPVEMKQATFRCCIGQTGQFRPTQTRRMKAPNVSQIIPGECWMIVWAPAHQIQVRLSVCRRPREQ